MGNSLRRVLSTLLWTAGLVLTLGSIDRLFLGPIAPNGWIRVASIDAVPAAAGKIKTPNYFPATLGWPPEKIFYQLKPHPGWWISAKVNSDEPNSGTVWIGTLVDDSLSSLGDSNFLADCLSIPQGLRCPEGWYFLSKQTPDNQTLYVLTNFSKQEGIRIIEGL